MDNSDSAGVGASAPTGAGSAVGDGRMVRIDDSDGAEDSPLDACDLITVVLYSEWVLDAPSSRACPLSPLAAPN